MEYIKKSSVVAVVGLFLVSGFAGPIAAFAATTPSLGAAATYGVLASTFTDGTPSATTINGNVGFTTSGATTSTILGTQANFGSGAPYSTAGTNEGNALSALATQPCTFNFIGAVNLSTDTTHSTTTGVYAPGVYCSSGAMDVGGPITLSGSGTYIFRPDGALTSDAGSIITPAGGASACDVFWTPTAATTLGANTTFIGTDIDDSGITVGANTTWLGRALSFAGTITTNTDTINVPTCTAPATLHVIKLVVGGTAAPSDFTLHVENAGGSDVYGSPALGAPAPGTLYSLAAGTYSVSENANAGYTQSFSGACDASGSITLAAGDDDICTVINSDIPTPVVVNNSGGSSGGGGGGGTIVPLIGITKVPAPLVLSAGPGNVTYAYTVWNVGGATPLTNVTVTDNKCSPVTYVSGDTNNNGQLDFGEHWQYTCATTLASTTTNTAIATGHAGSQTAVATAVATVVVGTPVPSLPNTGLLSPLINITKVPSRLTPFPFGGGVVTYTYTVTNPGVVAMNNVSVTDNKCAPVTYVSGDANHNSLLDPGEAWVYTCQTNIAASTMNTATAEGSANGITAIGYAFATVLVAAPGLPNTGFPPEGNVVPWIALIVAGLSAAALFYFIEKKHAAGR
jgi:uncharacterized repeat protein (TIGR01451 family)